MDMIEAMARAMAIYAQDPQSGEQFDEWATTQPTLPGEAP